MKNLVVRALQRVFEVASHRKFARVESHLLAEMRALFTLTALAPHGFVPWPKPSLSPTALATVLNDIVVNDRMVVVELGSGTSTVFLARILQRTGGKLWSIDQDETWSRKVGKFLEREGMGDGVELVVAPLTSFSGPDVAGEWYSDAVLSATLPSEGIDLLLVDGPASDTANPRIRYPAAVFFFGAMADECTIVLDDADRTEERRVAEAWEKEFGFSFRVAGGAGFYFRGAHYLPFL